MKDRVLMEEKNDNPGKYTLNNILIGPGAYNVSSMERRAHTSDGRPMNNFITKVRTSQ
jgi:hypothetical protein